MECGSSAHPRWAVLVLVGLSVLLVAPKCGTTVTVPSEDRTPPTTALYLAEPNEPMVEVPAEGLSRRIAPGEKITVFAHGEDASGLMRVTLISSSSMTCAAGTLSEERREDVTHTERNDVKPGEQGNTVLYTHLGFDTRFACGDGLAPRARRISLFATAENYHGGVATTPTLVIEVDPTMSPLTPPR
jgi:hypothetical protein